MSIAWGEGAYSGAAGAGRRSSWPEWAEAGAQNVDLTGPRNPIICLEEGRFQLPRGSTSARGGGVDEGEKGTDQTKVMTSTDYLIVHPKEGICQGKVIIR